MTEHLGLLPLEERMRVMQENEARERDYLASQEQHREHERITQQRRELEEHLTERGRHYLETTGQQPPQSALERWQAEFVETKAREHEADNRRRFEDAGYDQAAQRDTVF